MVVPGDRHESLGTGRHFVKMFSIDFPGLGTDG